MNIVDQFERKGRHLFYSWHIWESLFHRDSGQDALNRAMMEHAPKVFGYIRWSLLSFVILELAKLVDPDESMGHENLNINRACNAISGDGTPEKAARAALRNAADKIKASSIVKFRNKMIGHNDLPTALQRAMPPGLLISEIRTCAGLVGAASEHLRGLQNGCPVMASAPHHPEITDLDAEIGRIVDLSKSVSPRS